ncbi:N-acetylmuramidase domain-containing protein [Paraburkholderia lycopersici]|uniref:Peptidoglycan-binding (PGRP) domain of peptidoglycan hydrolases-containing protein n=1 Tax=Paraburkholderia lycopersici TaxID=416944 RepID=A0A1G7CQQ1_9BURK|nr:N-acetylmuramidase family protein [Paraburkholderia lycopersici]SDE41551.1 Peptidoglycan-binding (PGRP) domain of peptidoglycan hydrolases-containing protein [Paraburkholderia lycopersici]
MILRHGDVGDDVVLLQKRLTRAGFSVDVTHVFDDATEAAVMALQRARGLVVDGIAGPKTLIALPGVALGVHLTDAELVKSAATLGVPVPAIRAVNEVESRGQGFMTDGRPVILFERHVFYAGLKSRGIDADALAAKYPNIVSATRGGYMGGAAEFDRLAAAVRIHPDAARESASWGAFQIMGYHWKKLAYSSIDDYVSCMYRSEVDQLDAFVRFVAADAGLLVALKGQAWADFARRYNGPDFARNLYDAKLAQAFERYARLEKAAA